MTAFSRYRRAPQGAHAAWPSRGDDPFAGEALTPEAATEAIARMVSEERPLGSLVESHVPVTQAPRPTFTPRTAGPQTRADLVIPDPLSRRFPVPVTVRPVIGDSLRQHPEPEAEAPAEAGPGATAMLYSGPGWAAALMAARLRNGEVEELPALVEQGYGRNAAGFATVARHFRERITATAEQVCAAMGRPDLAGQLLRRVEQFNAEARLRAEQLNAQAWRQDRGAA